MTTRTRWALAPALIAVSALAVSGAVVAPAAHAAAPPSCNLDSDYTIGDVDNDGVADSVVGLPTSSGSRGAVDLNLTSAPSALVTRGSVAGFGPGAAGDRFGASAALADVDRDGCDDVIVGAPGEGGTGAVHIVFGAPTGFRTTNGVTIPAPDGAFDDRFGTALAVVGGQSEGVWSLWIGAPGRTVNGMTSAGVVYHYRLTHTGPNVTATLIQTVSQATSGVPGSSGQDDNFGSVLAASSSQLVVGVPQKDVGRRLAAGGIVRLAPSTDLPLASAQYFTQSSRGVRGVAARSDLFGASVAVMGDYVAAGIPGDDIRGRQDVGSVQLFRATSDGRLKVGKQITQGGRLQGRAVPGTDERGDNFGASVAFGVAFLCQEELDLAIGAPRENVGRRADAGAVTIVGVTGNGSKACKPKGIRQGKGLAGSPEKGDRVGRTLATVTGRVDFDEDRADKLFVGAPGENVGAVRNAGIVNGWRVNAFPSVGRTGGPQAKLNFGAVLATDAVATFA